MSRVAVYEFSRRASPTLVGVHGAGGLLFFGKLARVMGSGHSFYVMQGENLNKPDGDHGFSGIVELGSSMADEVLQRELQPPIYLCGRFGTVVLETGQQLLKRSADVGALIVIDNVAPALPGPDVGVSGFRRRLLKPVRSVLGVPDDIGLADWLKPGSKDSAPERTRSHPFMELNSKLSKGYRPSRFNGRIVLIRSESFAGKASKTGHPESWRRISDSFETYTVAGTHHTLFDPPNVRRLAALIDDIVSGAGESDLKPRYS